MINRLIFTCISFFACFTMYGQFDTSNPTDLVPSDTISAPTERGTLETLKVVFEGKPGKAATYGILIPAGGQFYNRRYWKVPVVLAADAAAIYWYIDSRREYRNFKSTLSLALSGESVSYRGISTTDRLRFYRDDFQLQSERAGITIVVLHLVSMIEAFTDRHLMEFDIDEDLSFHLEQQSIPIAGSYTSLGLIYQF